MATLSARFFFLSWYICHKHPCETASHIVCFIQLSEAGVLSVSLKMDKTEYRAVIKLFVKEGLTPNEIHSKFIKVYVDCSASFSTIKNWAAEYICIAETCSCCIETVLLFIFFIYIYLHSKGNKTGPGKVATRRTEDGHI